MSRLLERFERAVIERAFKGEARVEDHAEIEEEYQSLRARMLRRLDPPLEPLDGRALMAAAKASGRTGDGDRIAPAPALAEPVQHAPSPAPVAVPVANGVEPVEGKRNMLNPRLGLAKLIMDRMSDGAIHQYSDLATVIEGAEYKAKSVSPTLSNLRRAGYIIRTHHAAYQIAPPKTREIET